MNEFIRRHRNLLLIIALLLTLSVSWFFNRERLRQASVTVSLPVEKVTQPAGALITDYRTRRDAAYADDAAALERLCGQENLSRETREDAAAQLQQMIARREAQSALETALEGSGIAPCMAVVSPGSVTIVTEKDTLSQGESALVLTLAQAHADVPPSGVRVLTSADLK